MEAASRMTTRSMKTARPTGSSVTEPSLEDFVMLDVPPVENATLAGETPAISLSCSSEATALCAGKEHTVMTMVSLKASVHEQQARLPLEIVAVVDRSGSMSGAKIETMKHTLTFLVTKGLQSDDSLAIVSFDSTVETLFPLTKMGGSSKTKAIQAINELHPGSTTNLSGGLLQGIDLLQRAPQPAGGSTRAVLLFTDGIANVGIHDGPGIVEAAQGAMSAGAAMTIFTFGFGSDHNEDMLRSLADTTNGLYYYLDKVETIPQAFADCLGGLVAVVAQNATLLLEPAPGASIPHVHTSYKTTPTMEGGLEVSLGDVYAEEEKDLLLRLLLPVLTAPEEENTTCLLATLRYYSVPASRFATAEACLTIRRPATTPTEQPINMKLEEQRVRVLAAEAMAQAAKMADEGCLEEGRAALEKCRKMSLASPACKMSGTAAVLSDLEQVEAGYQDAVCYRSWGGKMSKMSAMSHMQQRSNHATGGAYERASKKQAKLAWLGK